jgi:hypothetical protein
MRVTDGPEKIVLILHGIRTMGWWQNRVAAILEDSGCKAIPIKYGYFDVFRFLMPLNSTRKGPILRLLREIDAVIEQYPRAELYVLAHSYGTYTLGGVLIENPRIKLKGIILCGSVLPKDFDWRRVSEQITSPQKRESIINECGTKDVWPILAQSVTWGYGATGTDGFGTMHVRDRFHRCAHSDYFTDEFVKDNWLPLFQGRAPTFTQVDRRGNETPWWFTLLRIPYRYLIALFFILFLVYGSYYFIHINDFKEVVIMDSSAIKYNPETPGSNARQIREILSDFKSYIRTSYEAVYKGYDADRAVIQRRPDLIIIHLSSFYDESKEGGINQTELERSDAEFRSFVTLICKKTKAKVLVYTRGLNGTDALPIEVKELLNKGYSRQKAFFLEKDIRNCAELFELSSPLLLRDGASNRRFKSRVSELLCIDN